MAMLEYDPGDYDPWEYCDRLGDLIIEDEEE